MSKKLGGILAAVSTPFSTNGDVDEAALRGHVDFLIDNGLHGLVPCGSTCEFAALTSDERKRVNEVVIDQAAGRVPGRPADRVDEHRRGRSGCPSMPPTPAPTPCGGSTVYEAPTRREVIEYFATVGEAAGIPVDRVQPARCDRHESRSPVLPRAVRADRRRQVRQGHLWVDRAGIRPHLQPR